MWNPIKKWFSKPNKRSYGAVNIGRLYKDWLYPATSADYEIYNALPVLRNRSRELSRNNDYAKKFLKMCITNIIGPSGIILQNKARNNDNGNFDKLANDLIEAQWAEWGKTGNCTVDGKLSWLDIQNLFIETVARDGEIIIRKIPGWDNKWRFALQILESDFLDEELNNKEPKIIMGVQIDQWGKPSFYHLLKYHPGDRDKPRVQKEYNIFPASEIIHSFRIERPGQTRGIPWMHAAMTRLHHVGQYEEAELVASRVGAAKMGFFTKPKDVIAEMIPDEETAEGNKIKSAEPGTFEDLPPGYDFKSFEPDHPVGNFQNFIKATLRGISAGLNVSYNSLACDLEGVNYSSLRSGSLEERDNWRILQSWMIDSFCKPVFQDWLYWSMVNKTIPLPVNKFEKFNASTWKPRGWAWVDPEKDSDANRKDVLAGFKTRSIIVGEMGYELEDIYEQLAEEEKLADKYGLDLKLEKPASQGWGVGNENQT